MTTEVYLKSGVNMAVCSKTILLIKAWITISRQKASRDEKMPVNYWSYSKILVVADSFFSNIESCECVYLRRLYDRNWLT